jgi:hypothetical protein
LTVALTLAVLVLLVSVFSKVGNSLINTERARIVSQVSALAAVYGGESEARKIAQANDATLCNFLEPTTRHPYFAVCVDVDGTQRISHAVDTWTNPVPTLEP